VEVKQSNEEMVLLARSSGKCGGSEDDNLSLRKIVLFLSVFLGTVAEGAAQNSLPGQGGTEQPPLAIFRSDRPILLSHRLGEGFAYSVRVEFETTQEVDYDLNSNENDNYLDILPELIGSAVYEPNDLLRVFAEMKLSHKLILESPVPEDEESELEIKQAYITFRDIVDGVSLSVGREYIGDERNWVLDEEMDGASLRLRNELAGVEFAYRREGMFPRDVLQPEYTRYPDYYFALGYAGVSADQRLDPFLIYQDGHEGTTDEDLLFVGLQSKFRFSDGLDGWADVALVIGEATDRRDVRGVGFDVGITKTSKTLPLVPYFTAAVAYGSGDDGSGTDTAFRQTGLQGNSDRFGGVTSLNYYGEVLDPELSNLGIVTLGLGVRPTPHSSIDLVYHRYHQTRTESGFRYVAIDEDPNGESHHVGDELDLVFGSREIERLDFSLSTGIFLPGAAFEQRDPAFSAKLEINAEL
jgi:alginate production protein